jgi:hypothetical protein
MGAGAAGPREPRPSPGRLRIIRHATAIELRRSCGWVSTGQGPEFTLSDPRIRGEAGGRAGAEHPKIWIPLAWRIFRTSTGAGPLVRVSVHSTRIVGNPPCPPGPTTGTAGGYPSPPEPLLRPQLVPRHPGSDQSGKAMTQEIRRALPGGLRRLG